MYCAMGQEQSLIPLDCVNVRLRIQFSIYKKQENVSARKNIFLPKMSRNVFYVAAQELNLMAQNAFLRSILIQDCYPPLFNEIIFILLNILINLALRLFNKLYNTILIFYKCNDKTHSKMITLRYCNITYSII